MPRDSERKWLGTRAAAAYLGIAESTLWRLVDEGKVPAYRPAHHFQFLATDLDEYLASTRIEPGTVANKRSDIAARVWRERKAAEDQGQGHDRDEG